MANELVHRAFTLLREVKSVSVATMHYIGSPNVRIADVMLAEEDGVGYQNSVVSL